MSNVNDNNGKEEAVVVILDTNDSMKNTPIEFSHDDGKDKLSRWDYAKRLVEEFTNESISKRRKMAVIALKARSQENLNNSTNNNEDLRASGKETITSYPCLRQATLELKRSIQKLDQGTQSESSECPYVTDFCQGILMAASIVHREMKSSESDDLTEEMGPVATGLVRIVLLTDAEHKITLENTDMTRLLVMIDNLRAMECQLHVIGFNFNEQAEFDQAALAEASKKKIEQVKGNDDKSYYSEVSCSDSDGDDDVSSTSCDDDDLQSVKQQNEKFLISLTEKTGGFVTSAQDYHSAYRKLSINRSPQILDLCASISKSTKEIINNVLSKNTKQKVHAEAKRPFEVIEIEDTRSAKRHQIAAKNCAAKNGKDDDNDVEIISPPLESCTTAKFLSLDSCSELVSWSNLTNPNVDYPHKRVDCGVYQFEREPESFCTNCYCVVCDIPASQCQKWHLHCKERPKPKRYQDILSQYVEGLNEGSETMSTGTTRNGLLERLLIIQEQYDRATSTSFSALETKRTSQSDNNGRLETSLSPGFSQRIYWDKSDDVSLDEWLKRIVPSQISPCDCAWIQVANIKEQSKGYSKEKGYFNKEAYMPALERITEIIDAGKRVSAKEKDRCIQSLSKTAIAQGHTAGKWMLHLAPEFVDKSWVDIARSTANGLLGCSAKIFPAMERAQENILCCVYVKEFSCREEVKRLLLSLKRDFGYNIRCGFKPDYFTDLGIYTGNPWRLKPVLYTVKEVLRDDFTGD